MALDKFSLVRVSTICSPSFQEKGMKESLKADLDGIQAWGGQGHGSQEDLMPHAPRSSVAGAARNDFPRLPST